MISDQDLRRYLADRHSFRREQIVLPNGRLFGQCEEPWQTEHIFGPLDAKAEDGTPRYRLLYNELHRGAGKTFVLAAEALATAILEEDVRVYCVAGDTGQAGITKTMLEGMIASNDSLASSFRILRDEIIVPSTNTHIKVMSSDAPTSYGLGGLSRGFLVLADELWVWPNRNLWDAFFSAAAKSPDWRILVASNCGFDRDSLAWGVREMCRTQVDPRFHFYSPPGVVASWISEEELETQRRSLPEPVFERLWENKWSEGVGSFLTAELWDSCKRRIPRLDEKTPVVVGLDAGVRHDSFGIVVVSRHPEMPQTGVAVREVRLWRPPRGGDISYYGDGSPDAWLREFIPEHNVVQISYDEFQLHGLTQQLNRDLGTWTIPFGQGPPRLRADSLLLSLIKEQRLAHNGDEALRTHMLGAGFKLSRDEDSKMRIVKSHPRKKVDLCVALSMASDACLELIL